MRMTRQNYFTLGGTLPYAGAGKSSQQWLPKSGFLAKLVLSFAGTLNCKHASKTTFTKAAKAPFNVMSDIKLFLNTGLEIYHASGWMTYLRNLLEARNITTDTIVANRDVFQFGNAVDTVGNGGANNAINFKLEIPVVINERDPVGLLMLQSDKLQTTMQILWADPTVLMTDTDVTCVLTGQATITMEYFDIPENADARPDASLLHFCIEDSQALTGVGDNKYIFQPGRIYQRAIAYVEVNGAAVTEAAMVRMALKHAQKITDYSLDGEIIRYLNRKRYGRDLPAGAYVWDWGYQGLPVLGSGRDYIDTRTITEFWNMINIASGTTFGSGNNNVYCLSEFLGPVSTV